MPENHVEFITRLRAVVGLIFSFGAILGALNTTYAQVTAHTRELGTLRAIGFKPRAILVSLVLESAILSLAAGVMGLLPYESRARAAWPRLRCVDRPRRWPAARRMPIVEAVRAD